MNSGATRLGVRSVSSRAMRMEDRVGRANGGMVSLCPWDLTKH